MTSPDVLAKYLLRRTNRAIEEFELLAPGDRIAVAFSGGKDSLTLLDLLQRGVQVPNHDPTTGKGYSFVAVHVDGVLGGLPDSAGPVKALLDSLGVEYHIEPLRLAPTDRCPLDCFRCSFNRRRTLFEVAASLNCNKVAFGHHADDAATTTLMNLIHKGKLETMVPKKVFFEGAMTIIRPLIYTPESEIRRFVKASGWQIPQGLDCHRSGCARRNLVENFLHEIAHHNVKQIRANLWRSGREAMGF